MKESACRKWGEIIFCARLGPEDDRQKGALFEYLIRVAERFFSGVPQPPPPWRLLPESFLYAKPGQNVRFAAKT